MRVGEMARQTRRLRLLVHPLRGHPLRGHPLRGSPYDYNPLMEFIGDARLVLLGASTHGTAEFEAERAAITRLLIEERGFAAVATSLDWTAGLPITAYAAGRALEFDSGRLPPMPFPAWSVHNREVAAFLHWLRDWNERHATEERVTFHGLDVYGTHRATAFALALLDAEDAAAGARMRERAGRSGRGHGVGSSPALSHALEDHIVAAMTADLEKALAPAVPSAAGLPEIAPEYRESLVRQAPGYYRALLAGSVASQNLRARRLADTLSRLVEWLDSSGAGRGVALWLDNLEAGDARATDMGRSGELSLGQLVRERWSRDAVSIGFTTYEGTVLAAREWGGEPGEVDLLAAQPGSYEAILQDLDEPRVLMFTAEADAALPARRPERAIGPVLRSAEDERHTYFEATIGRQYDAVLHIGRTTALAPLD